MFRNFVGRPVLTDGELAEVNDLEERVVNVRWPKPADWVPARRLKELFGLEAPMDWPRLMDRICRLAAQSRAAKEVRDRGLKVGQHVMYSCVRNARLYPAVIKSIGKSWHPSLWFTVEVPHGSKNGITCHPSSIVSRAGTAVEPMPPLAGLKGANP